MIYLPDTNVFSRYLRERDVGLRGQGLNFFVDITFKIRRANMGGAAGGIF